MTKPSDFDPTEVIEIANGNKNKALRGRYWMLRLSSLILAGMGWAGVTFTHWREHDFLTLALINAAVMAALGAFGVIAASLSRREAVNLEKRLRLRLLVHNVELQNMAMRDDLTHLFNRRYFFDRLERELQMAKSLERPLAIIIFDIDSLKKANDSFGHRMGDQILRAFGQFLLEHTRATDIPARIGGDEFAVILPGTHKRGANIMAQRLAQALEQFVTVHQDGTKVPISASFGLAGYPWSGQDVDSIMQQADAAMYASKQARKRGRPAPHPGQPGVVIPSHLSKPPAATGVEPQPGP